MNLKRFGAAEMAATHFSLVFLSNVSKTECPTVIHWPCCPCTGCAERKLADLKEVNKMPQTPQQSMAKTGFITRSPEPFPLHCMMQSLWPRNPRGWRATLRSYVKPERQKTCSEVSYARHLFFHFQNRRISTSCLLHLKEARSRLRGMKSFKARKCWLGKMCPLVY